jgi:hypothetical protein
MVVNVKCLSCKGSKFHSDFIGQINANFDEREIVILVSTAAQVNYWARLIRALGIPPPGFLE